MVMAWPLGGSAIVPLTAMGSLIKQAPIALKALHDMVNRASDTGNKYWLDKEWVRSNLGRRFILKIIILVINCMFS